MESGVRPLGGGFAPELAGVARLERGDGIVKAPGLVLSAKLIPIAVHGAKWRWPEVDASEVLERRTALPPLGKRGCVSGQSSSQDVPITNPAKVAPPFIRQFRPVPLSEGTLLLDSGLAEEGIKTPKMV